MNKSGASEIILCKHCGAEYELYYNDDDHPVHESKCSCKTSPKRINGLLPLDHAIKQIDKKIQSGEIK
jgi:hypothetical protein